MGSTSTNLVRSGLPVIDEQLGGLPIGSITVLHGAPRSGKTWCALAVTREALARGSRCLYVTSDDPGALCAQAERCLGFDLRTPIADGSLVVIGPGPWFTHKLRSLGGAERALDELGKLVWSRGLDTVVFDSFDVVLAAAEPVLVKRFVRGTLAALNKLSTTCLLTGLGPYTSELALAAHELAASVPTVLTLGEGEPCASILIRASWTDIETLPVEMVARYGPVSQKATIRKATGTPRLAAMPPPLPPSRAKASHLKAV